MTGQLRWILLIVGSLFVVALALWERRRPRQANPHSADRAGMRLDSAPRARQEPRLTLPEVSLHPAERHALPRIDLPADENCETESRAATDEVPVLDPAPVESEVDFEPADDDDEPREAPQPAVKAAPAPAVATAPQESPDYVPRGPSPAPPLTPAATDTGGLRVEWPPDAERRIVAVRLVAPQPQRFAGRSLRQALAAEGFVLGRFDIFHKPDEAQRAVLSAASLNRPGTFDTQTMDTLQFGGLSLFAVLPGPRSPSQAFDELVFTARNLNERLQGVLQDEEGGPLTPARIATLRERLSGGAAS
ncbi:MAG: hypothetical protein JSS29_11255 [Proteobacteria bacterium]|nr:hypothetical protein [Pseudomonadota bacterium]